MVDFGPAELKLSKNQNRWVVGRDHNDCIGYESVTVTRKLDIN